MFDPNQKAEQEVNQEETAAGTAEASATEPEETGDGASAE